MATIEQKIEALQLVRAEVAAGEDFVCIQLENLGRRCKRLYAACDYLARYTQAAVISSNNYGTLDAWICDQLGDDALVFCDPHYKGRMRATRLAWIDWMISCYQEDLAARGQSKYQVAA
jgi:hypothetical protein